MGVRRGAVCIIAHAFARLTWRIVTQRLAFIALLNTSTGQMFAGAIAVIYNNPSVDNLILTRTLVNDIFLGRVTSW